MTEQAIVDYCCPYAEKETISKFLKEGRTCKISGQLCFNWHDYGAVGKCEAKKNHDEEKRD